MGAGTGKDKNLVEKTFTAGESDGEYVHTLTTGEMPTHGHGVYLDGSGVYTGRRGFNTGGGAKAFTRDGADGNDYSQWVGNHNHTVHQSNAGGGQAHNNLQPYLVVYMWKRTA
jgi:microcystin-dependent protein